MSLFVVFIRLEIGFFDDPGANSRKPARVLFRRQAAERAQPSRKLRFNARPPRAVMPWNRNQASAAVDFETVAICLDGSERGRPAREFRAWLHADEPSALLP